MFRTHAPRRRYRHRVSDYLRRVLHRALAAWDSFVWGEIDLDALRDSVRVAAGALDGADQEWREFLDDWSLNLDGMDVRVTRFRSKHDVSAEVQERFRAQAESVRDHLAQHEP